MSQTHHSAQWPARAIGILAALRVFPRATGSGTPAPVRRLALALGLVVLAAGALTASPALAARGHVFSGSFGSEGAGHGQFNWPDGVAVNEATGNVYVLDRTNNSVQYFTATGTYLGEFNGSTSPTGKFSEPTGVAVDNSCQLQKPALTGVGCEAFDPSDGDVYVLDTGHEVIDKFTANGAYVGQITMGYDVATNVEVPLAEVQAIAVGATGLVYVTAEHEGKEILTYSDATQNALETIHFAQGGFLERGLAVASNPLEPEDVDLYVVTNSGGKVEELTYEGQVVQEEVDGSEVKAAHALAVEPTTNDLYVDNQTDVRRVSPAGSQIESFGSEQLVAPSGEKAAVQVSGIAVDAATGTIYVANPADDDVDIYALEQEGAPLVSGESVSEVSAESATLAAELKPSGSETSYHYEYGPVSCASAPSACSVTPTRSLPAEFGAESLAPQTLDGLSPNTEYHYRLVAKNGHGVGYGVEQTFTTQRAGELLALPDGRQWEMVSPPAKNGGLINPPFGVLQAAESGSAISYEANAPIGEDIGGDVSPAANQELSTRGPDGWSTRDINTPNAEAVGDSGGEGGEYRLFNSDLSLAALEPNNQRNTAFGETPLEPEEAPERTLYRSNLAGLYTPLVRDGNVPAGTHYGYGELQFIDGTANLEHLVLSSSRNIALTPTPLKTKQAAEENRENTGLYEWSEGALRLISVLPSSEEKGEAALEPQLGQRDGLVRNAISADGSRVIWSTGEHLYLRDTARQETIRLDMPQAGARGGDFKPVFQEASEDGSRIFFTDEAALTEDSTASAGYADLYVFEVTSGDGPLSGTLYDLSAMGIAAGSGEASSLQGESLGTNEEGTVIYYVANGVLAEPAKPGKCDTGKPSATCSLYMQRFDSETGSWLKPAYIATLSSNDHDDWLNLGEGENESTRTSDLNRLTASVSPDGRFVAFMSDRSLTGYDNDDAVSGVPDQEVYLYDSQTGRLVCVSCDPTGGRPYGVESDGHLLVDPGELFGGRWIAGSLPESSEVVRGEITLYQARYLSNEGRLFFDSSDALVPQDTNGEEDVYEYEPPATASEAPANDSCSPGSVTYNSRSGGCVSLISAGTSSAESEFLDASANGDDVFFLTKSQLSRADVDQSYDVYDAHVCMSTSPCVTEPAEAPPACDSGDACRPEPSLQPSILGAPASATFSGEGNVAPAPVAAVKAKAKPLTRAQKLAAALKACRKKAKGKRAVCERQARKKYALVSKRKAKSRKGGK